MKKIILSKCFLHVVLLTLAFCLFPVLPAFAQEDIVNRLDKALGVTLPSEYKSKVKAFVQGSKVLEGLGVIPTEKFIKEQMKEDWGINKQNQLLFIWDAIYEQITKKNFYDGEDGNKQRLDDFENALDKIEACGKKYKQDYKAYMEQQSAEAKQQSAEARQQSAEARQNRIMIAYYGLYQITSCYQLRDYAPESEIKDETWFWKDLKEYQSNLINFKNSISYDKSIDTLTIRFRDGNMIEYLFNNSFEVLEYYSHLGTYKTILAIVIPGFKIRNKAFIKKLSTIYPQYLYWDLIESMLMS